MESFFRKKFPVFPYIYMKGENSMPNWTRNLLMVGNEKRMKIITDAHCPYCEENKKRELDFNTIIRMPDELNIEYGSKTIDGLALALGEKDPSCPFLGQKEDKLEKKEFNALKGRLNDRFLMFHLDSLTDAKMNFYQKRYGRDLPLVMDIGRKALSNFLKYNALSWYDWSLENWGVKWNASDTLIQGTELYFKTPWDPPLKVFLELSRLHPEIPLAMIYADEQIGAKTGYIMAKAGKADYIGTFKDFSADAYKLAFQVWKNQDDYVYDEKNERFTRKN